MFITYCVDVDGRGRWFIANNALTIYPIDPSDCEWLVPGTWEE